MTIERLRREMDRPDLWDEETVRRAVTSSYLNTAHAHRSSACDEAAHDAAADMLDRAYWAEIDNERI